MVRESVIGQMVVWLHLEVKKQRQAIGSFSLDKVFEQIEASQKN